MELNLLTLDVETTLNAPKEVGSFHPMWPTNEIVLLGTKYRGHPAECIHKDKFYPVWTEVDFVVGCNLSFDLLYMYRTSGHYKAYLQRQPLWDIQLAEYILTGQKSKFPSLDKMAVKYGYPVKDSRVTEYFDKGLGSEHVPIEMLTEYLKHDLDVTEGIACKQMVEATKNGQLTLIISQMEALHCITEMMFNGLRINRDYLGTYAGEVATHFVDLKCELEDLVKTATTSAPYTYPLEDVDSPTQWSKFLFGGTKKVTKDEVVGVYKNGKTKTKKVTEEVKTDAYFLGEPLKEWKSEKTGKVSVDDKVLTYINNNSKDSKVTDITKKLQEYREQTKQLTTYIQGLGKHIININIPANYNYIYGRLNQTSTATGRLSSTAPNLQNISNNPIKKIFISRWALLGSLVEFDFSQLEVAILAHLTKDPRLIADISGGKDIHSELYFDMFKVYPDVLTRKWFKSLTFGLIYGAGANTLAENAGCSYDVAKKFIDTFYKRYAKVRDWNNYMQNQAELHSIHPVEEDFRSFAKQYTHCSETGRKYVFNEYHSTYRTDREYNFSPTELKNYPVQGLATGDIVPMMLGILFKTFVGRDGILLVNTVHDSILFDVRDDVLSSMLKEVDKVLSNTHAYYEKTFGIPLALKLTTGCSVGKNWYEMKEVKLHG